MCSQTLPKRERASNTTYQVCVLSNPALKFFPGFHMSEVLCSHRHYLIFPSERKKKNNPALCRSLLFHIGLFSSALFPPLLPFQPSPCPQSLSVSLLHLCPVLAAPLTYCHQPLPVRDSRPLLHRLPCAPSPLSPLSPSPDSSGHPLSLHNLHCLLDCPGSLSHLPLKGIHSLLLFLY